MSRLGSPQAGSRRVAIAKPKNDVYVALLSVAVVAILVGIVLMLLELKEYEWTTNPKAALVPSATPAPSPNVAAATPHAAFDSAYRAQRSTGFVV